MSIKRILAAGMGIIVALSLTACANHENITSEDFVLDSTELQESQKLDATKQPVSGTQEISFNQDTVEVSPRVIVLDPGHASTRTTDYEPVGPGSQETKMASVIGTRGVSTGVYEFDRVLEISKVIREELQRRGYQVIMTKETNEKVLSNIQRAQIANDAHADAFLRIHADASEDPYESGAMAMCISASNPFIPSMYSASRLLADCILTEYCLSTGFHNRGVEETDSMTGNNWSLVPCILMEMGYMTNSDDDLRLASAEMQTSIAQGIANGLDRYFNSLET